MGDGTKSKVQMTNEGQRQKAKCFIWILGFIGNLGLAIRNFFEFSTLFQKYMFNRFREIMQNRKWKGDFPPGKRPRQKSPCPPLLKGGWGGFQRWVGKSEFITNFGVIIR
jgi:hypothetical protein